MQPFSGMCAGVPKINSYRVNGVRKVLLIDGATKHPQNIFREGFGDHELYTVTVQNSN